MKSIKYASLIVLFLLSPLPVSADTAAIEQRLEALENEVKVLKRQLELAKEEETQKAKEDVIVTANAKDGFSIKSADEHFKLKFRGVLQLDGRFFTDNKKNTGTSDTFFLRRARPIFEGTLARDLDFLVMPDFGSGTSQLVDGYVEYKYFPQFKIKGGKFKVPLALERLQSDPVANFAELGLTNNLTPNRDVGVQISGDVLKDSLNYTVAFFNGGVDAGSTDTDNNNDKDAAVRIFAHPFKNQGPASLKGIGIGVAGSYGHREGAASSSSPAYKSAGQATIFNYGTSNFDGAQTRLTPQAYYYNGPLGLIGEYVISRQKLARTSGSAIIRDTFDNHAWQISGNYVLTGESASYKGITPRVNFDPAKGTWGAFDVVGRFGHLAIDNSIFDNGFASLDTSVSGADEWAVGLNWYPNKNFRLYLDFSQTRFDRGATSGNDRPTENLILSRFQLTY